MGVTFTTDHTNTYHTVTFSGQISDTDMLESYKEFYTSNNWVPGYSELVDVSKADLSRVTTTGILRLAMYVSSLNDEDRAKFPCIAIFAPHGLSCEIGRMYSVKAVNWKRFKVFHSREKAQEWIISKLCFSCSETH